MLNRIKIEKLDDYFLDLSKRKLRGVYFYRINKYDSQIHNFIKRYYEAARINGVIIEGRLKNPNNNNLAYFNEIIGMNFQMNLRFINVSLKKWLPKMENSQIENVSHAIYDTLINLKNKGKNDNMLKNAYIKFMCWLYYRFERIANNLGKEKIPKILYEGNISIYELLLMNVLSSAGCDILLLQYQGDTEYLKVDPDSSMSSNYIADRMNEFPDGFSLKQIQREIQDKFNRERLYSVKPKLTNCTNAWISGNIFDDVRLTPHARGNDERFFYNCYCRISGVEDINTYENELYRLQLEIKNSKRCIVILNDRITPPSIDEINDIKRNNYKNIEQLVRGLSQNIRYTSNKELQDIMIKCFIDVVLEEFDSENKNLNRITNKAVYLLCWLKRYQKSLFANWKSDDITCFFYLGGCRNDSEAMFCRFLSRMPVDVLIFNPDLSKKCCLKDSALYEINYENSMRLEVYPDGNAESHIGTSAYHAEKELDTIMYQGTGMYRNQQYVKANTILLHTMYEEIDILWDEELKYRPNFSIVDDTVNIPVIFTKVCGVKDGLLSAYWDSIRKLATSDTIIIKKVPNIESTSANPMKAFVTEFFKNGKVQRRKIKNHRAYRYGFLRESIQEYLLDKIQLLIEEKLIKGTFENGTEYTIVATTLNLEKNILRLIQKFDFTRKNPKLIYIITGEEILSLEDTIVVAFLNLIGFDIMFFVPTGYRCVEKFLNNNIIEEHQIGEYLYDLQIPDLDRISDNVNTRPSWRELIFKRGT